ncbi:motility associated factor glycosyltransferase family protein [Celerinatantimonas yamalensis]|uniref:6-hydroxymethylpterin diphosphokinase MptE-like protein n=1 Tax=Celerinatantimonas yamalensis TaxID=559956 RepID=A0ABW9G5X6_9GAMM
MLNAIDYQLCSDEARQQANEAQLAPVLLKRQQLNLAALAQVDEALAEKIKQHLAVAFAPFVTRKKYINVMHVSRARALYPVVPPEYVARQVADFCRHALCIDKRQDYSQITPQRENAQNVRDIFPGIEQRYVSLDVTPGEALVVLGCGLGHHLLALAQSSQWQSIVIVEPQFDLLKASMISGPWHTFLHYCQFHHIDLTIIAGHEGSDNLPQLQQWLIDQPAQSFHVFRHYQYPLFCRIEMDLALGRVHWQKLTSLASRDSKQDRYYEFSFSLNHYLDVTRAPCNSGYFDANCRAFRQFLPEIADSFASYQAKRWVLFQSGETSWNVIDIEQGNSLFLDDAEQESLEYLRHYGKHPRLDALDARNGARKSSPYLHYDYSDKLKALVQELPQESFQQLPRKLPSFLMYGCALGYQLQALVNDHEVDNLIIYEPNSDYFYASLILIDWQRILTSLDERQANLYLNIGDNGENMVDDILTRLSYSGIHILSYTFFYVSYYQSEFDQHIRQTREHFKILLNISEYYDHAFYNLTHTRESFAQNRPYLRTQRDHRFQQELAQIPVFIVGNGPSLDGAVEALREYQDRAIIISCGTSLKALYQYGIRPDFHAEVEQTRSTYHWICQVPDKQWLKQIDLLTVNGVHPDVSDLFRQTLLCFKRGEAATLAHLLANSEGSSYQDILYSYPTVSNCAVAYTLALGFKQIYLFGVDLGFKDPRYHHSQQSAYFKEQDGSEIYDYAQHGVGLRVPGNFDDYVFTKYEFRYSAEIIEKTLAEYVGVDCYNTSDGSLIQGTTPLRLDQLLILNEPLDKAHFRQQLLATAYDTQTNQIATCLNDWFSDSQFDSYIDSLLDILEQPCASWQAVLAQLTQQMAVLGSAASNYHSLFFVLMRGSMNSCLTYLTRLAFSGEDQQLCMHRYEQGKVIWQDYLRAIRQHYTVHQGSFDQTPGLDF